MAKNLKLLICIKSFRLCMFISAGMGLVTLFYILTNMAYLMIFTVDEIVATSTIAMVCSGRNSIAKQQSFSLFYLVLLACCTLVSDYNNF